ncbi:TetR family transcriptional regulator [Dermatobacter hominis]|uniref:TetR family transcriptional regulator n=1 Tax=Dermatobacter hominis TaxID=2884263 RepID=UPI001D117871|nr:TetR family transcriptional regulator [Dermatobacter hominis]UDY35389.1 TetR/AcrR family transcriptional regulator [Dermatobacter hominis]
MSERKRRTRESRSERREELLDAAVLAIRREGAGVSMEDIAHEAGITKPILYANFGDKAGLADALATRFSRDLIARFGEAWATSEDTRERVERAIDAWVGFIESDPHIYRFLSEGSFGAGRRLEDRRLVSDVGVVVARALGEWLREQGSDSGPAEPWAYGVLGMVHVTTEWWLDRRTLSRRDLVEYLTSLLWTGFSGNGLTPTPDDGATPSVDVPAGAAEAGAIQVEAGPVEVEAGPVEVDAVEVDRSDGAPARR